MNKYHIEELLFVMDDIVARLDYDRGNHYAGYMMCNALKLYKMENGSKLVWNVCRVTTHLNDHIIGFTEAYEIEKNDDLYTIEKIK